MVIVSLSWSRSGGAGRKEMVDAREAVAMERTKLERRKCRGVEIPGSATILLDLNASFNPNMNKSATFKWKELTKT